MGYFPPIQERRISMRLVAYWQEMRGDRKRALSADLDPERIKELWPHCFCLVPGERLAASELTHIGRDLAKASDIDQTGILYKDVPKKTLIWQALKRTPEVLESKVPITHSGQFTDRSKQIFLYRGVVLPLVNKRGQVDLILGGARYRGVGS